MDDWRGCTLVNPLCPDDLCVLPPHKGWHCLSTMIEPGPVWSGMKRAAAGTSRENLIQLGCDKAAELKP